MKYKIKHFDLAEFKCPCCGEARVTVPLVFWLDVIRDAVAHPLIISSGYRCLKHNQSVNGAVASRHMIGCAVDLPTPKALNYNVFLSIVQRFKRDGFELVDHPRQAYLHFAVSRADLDVGFWDGRPEVVL